MIHEKALLSPKFRRKVSAQARTFSAAAHFDARGALMKTSITCLRLSPSAGPVVPVTDSDHFFAEAHCGDWEDQAFRSDPRAPEFFRIFVETADQQIVKPNAA